MGINSQLSRKRPGALPGVWKPKEIKKGERIMFNRFEYFHGGNPYITKTNKELFRMFCKYYYTQIGEHSFMITGVREWTRKTYEGKKLVLRAVAVDWQSDFERFAYSWGDLADWQSFFEELGKEYGLITEFKENGII